MTVVARCALVFGVLTVRFNGLAFESSCHTKNRRACRAPAWVGLNRRAWRTPVQRSNERISPTERRRNRHRSP
jgi:hypothetical protein